MLPMLLLLQAQGAVAAALPHIAFLLADDFGFADIGYRGTDVQTPHLDDLAAAGIKLDAMYTALVCSPSRGSIMTGKFPYRLGLSHGFIAAGAQYGLPLTENTMAQEMTAHGWTSHMVGKVIHAFAAVRACCEPCCCAARAKAVSVAPVAGQQRASPSHGAVSWTLRF